MSWIPKETVVVPIDFSDESLAALQSALDFVEDASHLHAIHVLPRISPMEPGVVWGEVDDESRSRHAQEALEKRVSGGALTGTHLTVAVGSAPHEITEHAKKVGADLIILPSHGRTGARHVLIGSVAERVVRYAHCPVLVLRK